MKEGDQDTTSSVCDLGKLLNLQEPQFPHLQNGDNNACLSELFEY